MASGGKRKNSGRKPVGDNVKEVKIYLPIEIIEKIKGNSKKPLSTLIREFIINKI